MQYGLLLLGEHAPDRLLNLARFAEAHNFENLWYGDEKFFRDPYISLTHLAHHTKRIRLGICVTDPYTRHPALTAMAMGTLDEVTGGRAMLGLGAGSSGLHSMGLHQSRPVAALREAITLIRRLWAGETVTMQGEVIAFHGGELNFRARPDIPILIASSGHQILRLAGEMADSIMLGDLASARVIAPALAEVQRGAERSGRSLAGVPLIARANLILSDDPSAARALMRPWIAVGLWHTYPRWDNAFNYSPEWDERFKDMRMFIERHGGKPRNVGDFPLIVEYTNLIPDDLVRDAALVGTPDEVVQQIVEIASMGITQIALYPMPLEGQTIESVLERFVREVLEQLQR